MPDINPLRILFIFISCSAVAQNNFYYPNNFNAYFLNMSQITPASFPDNGRVELASGYKSLTGAFRKVSAYQFSAGRIFRKNKRAHLVRLQFYNEKEGSYISSPRGYANYGYLLPVSDNFSFFSGIAAGFTGLFYSAPTTTQSSFTLPDGSVGLGIKSDWFELGGSAMQILNAEFSPVKSTIRLSRYYHLYSSFKKEWLSEWYIKAYALYRFLPKLEPDVIITGAIGYSASLEAGVAVKYLSGISFYTVIGTNIAEDRLKILLNYNSPFFGLLPRYQSNIELGLSYLVFDKQ